MVEGMVLRRLKPSVILFILLLGFMGVAFAQARFRPVIEGDYPASVFVVTNRLIETDKDGRLIYMNEVDTAKPLKYVKVTFKDDEYFSEPFNSFDDLLANPAPYSDWLIWAHGDGQSFLLSMKRALEIQHLHKVNFIVFSWPTQAPDKGPIANHKNSRENAEQSVAYLEELCSVLQEYRSKESNAMQGQHLSIFFHSLANYKLELALEQGDLDNIREGLFDNMILNAPAVNSAGHYSWVEKLDIQNRIFVCYNDEDINLEGLRVLSSLDVQLGERPLEPLAGNARYLDFTYSVGSRMKTGATHSYYYNLITEISSNIREVYRDLFHGRELKIDDPLRFETTDHKQVTRVKF
jgi:hypothetical protein